jgi:hypothetical protein
MSASSNIPSSPASESVRPGEAIYCPSAERIDSIERSLERIRQRLGRQRFFRRGRTTRINPRGRRSSGACNCCSLLLGVLIGTVVGAVIGGD